MVAPDGSRRRLLLAGWPRAVLGAVFAAAVGLALAEAIAFGFAAAGGSAGSPGVIARAGSLLFFSFHHVPLVFQASIHQPGDASAQVITLTLATAPMLGTLAVAATLFAVARSNARRAATRTPLVSGIEGAKVAVPYAAICGLGAVVSTVTLTPTGSARILLAGAFVAGPSVGHAFVWPAVIAALAGVAGGMGAATGAKARNARSVGSAATRGPAETSVVPVATVSGPGRGTAVAILGGAAMACLGLLLAFGGLLVLAAVERDASRSYFDGAFGRGPTRGIAAVGLTALEVPDMTTWVLYPAMGSCVELATTSRATSGATGVSTCVVSYRVTPGRSLFARPADMGRLIRSGAANEANVPRGYLLFALVPGVAVLAGGWFAARFAGVTGAAAAAAVGALAGVGFAVWSIPIVLLARTTIAFAGAGSGAGASVGYAVGPALTLSVVAAAGWGVVGGAAGGALGAWARARRSGPVRERVFPSE